MPAATILAMAVGMRLERRQSGLNRQLIGEELLAKVEMIVTVGAGSWNVGGVRLIVEARIRDHHRRLGSHAPLPE